MFWGTGLRMAHSAPTSILIHMWVSNLGGFTDQAGKLNV